MSDPTGHIVDYDPGEPSEEYQWPISAESYHEFIEELCKNIPEEFSDDIAVEAIILKYVRHLESQTQIYSGKGIF
jgi:hypothetical protein